MLGGGGLHNFNFFRGGTDFFSMLKGVMENKIISLNIPKTDKKIIF